MKNIIFKVCLITWLLIFFAACTDLEENLRDEVTSDINLPGVGGGPGGPSGDALSPAFNQLRGTGTANHGSYYSIQEITTDEMVITAKGGDWFDGGILVDLHRHTYGPTHDFVNNTWVNHYAAINACNELLERGLDDNGVAQIRALRAYFYYRLADVFGNVKLVTSVGQDVAQTDRVTVFSFVVSELLASLGISDVTPGLDLSGSALGENVDAYRINRYAALGILAKVYLNAEAMIGTPMYDKAAIAASYIIDSGVYQLCGTGCSVPNLGRRPEVASDPAMLEGFPAVFAPNNEGNPEHIFTVEYDEVNGGGMNFHMMSLHYSSQFTYNFNDQPWNGYATLEEFYNSFEDNDIRKRHSFLAGPQTDFSGSAILDFAADDGDIVLNYTPKINELVPNAFREAGARPAKFSYKQLARSEMDNDYPIVRLGEVYLIRGEALARSAGDWNLALPDVNILRTRAGVSTYNSIDADEFLAERGREMFQESVRRQDLIRFGKYNGTWWEKPASDPHVNIFPIPFAQIQAATGFPLTQNPGY